MRTPRSLRARLARSLSLAVVALSVAGGLVSAELATRRLRRDFDARLVEKALGLVSLTEQYRGHIEFDFADEFMPEFSTRAPLEYFQIVSASLDPLAAPFWENSRSFGKSRLTPPADLGDEPKLVDMTLPDGREGRGVWIAFVPQLEDEADPFAERVIGRGEAANAGLRHATLLVARGAESLDAVVLWIHLSHLTVSILVSLTAWILVGTLLRRGLAPLASLAEQVSHIDESSLDGRIRLPQADAELGLIVDRLNDSYARLRQAFDRERRFSSDVAHELRTPLAELRSLGEIGARFAGEPAERERFFTDIVGVSIRLDNLVGRLLDLSRSEAGATAVCLRSVAIDELVDEIVSLLAPTIERRRLTLVTSIPQGRTVLTDPDHLEILVLNLLENAVDYAPEGTEVRVTAPESSVDPTLFEVTNLAPHLEASDLTHMFERLWRKDPVRGDRRHSGLGLALTQSIGQRLNLKIDARIDSAGRLTMRVAATT